MTNLGDRRTYLGASEVGAALGYSPYTTRRELWEYKTGRRAAKAQTPQMRRGHDLEPVIAALYEEQEPGRKIMRREQEYTHPTLSWLKYHADGVYTSWGGVVGLIEFKAPGSQVYRSWVDGGLPVDYIFQIQTGMLLAGYSSLSAAVYDYEQHRVRIFDVDADQKFQGAIINGAMEFWDFVTSDTPPPDVVESIEIPTVDGALKMLEGPKWDDLADILLQARTTKLMAEKDEEQVIATIKREMEARGMGLAMLGRTCRISWVPGKPRTNVKGAELLRWVQERIHDFDPSPFVSESPNRPFRPTFYGEAKEEIDAAR